MKQELSCHIVQDLLPNFIEKMTSDETNIEIQHHLDTCDACKETFAQMNADIGDAEKVPGIELKFLKKMKKTRLLAAALCVVLTLVSSYLIYASEYKFTNDKGNLSAAITEYTSPFEDRVDAYVLETKEINGMLVVSFKDQGKKAVYGVAVLKKGINQKYRMIRVKLESSPYSSVVQVYPLEIKKKPYYVVSGYNISEDIKYYGLDYHGYTNPGYLSEDRVRESIKREVKNQQFLQIYPVEEIEGQLDESVKETLHHLRLSTPSTSLYNAEGKEVTEQFAFDESAVEQVSSGIGKAELFMLYIFIAIVLGVGSIMTRYFLTE